MDEIVPTGGAEGTRTAIFSNPLACEVGCLKLLPFIRDWVACQHWAA